MEKEKMKPECEPTSWSVSWCPKCDKDLDQKYVQCPNCGQLLDWASKPVDKKQKVKEEDKLYSYQMHIVDKVFNFLKNRAKQHCRKEFVNDLNFWLKEKEVEFILKYENVNMEDVDENNFNT